VGGSPGTKVKKTSSAARSSIKQKGQLEKTKKDEDAVNVVTRVRATTQSQQKQIKEEEEKERGETSTLLLGTGGDAQAIAPSVRCTDGNGKMTNGSYMRGWGGGPWASLNSLNQKYKRKKRGEKKMALACTVAPVSLIYPFETHA